MIEDLPQPDVPQMATTLFFLLSTFMLTFFKTKTIWQNSDAEPNWIVNM
jgi:hypothetical protein